MLTFELSEDHLMADEFSHELAEGMAYVAGHDHELRPVMVYIYLEKNYIIFSFNFFKKSNFKSYYKPICRFSE